MKSIWFQQSIKNKILISVLAVFILAYVSTLAFIYRQNKHELLDSASTEALSTAKIIAISIYRNYELNKDTRKIQSFIVGVKRSKNNISTINVLTPKLKIANSTKEKTISNTVDGVDYDKAIDNYESITLHYDDHNPSESFVHVIYPISAGTHKTNTAVGIVEIFQSLERVVTQLETTKINMIFAGLLIVLAIMLAIMYVSYSITQPITKLYQGMNRANDGDLGVRVPVQSQDEIGYVTETFNTMLSSIQKSNQELRANALTLRDLNKDLTGMANRLREAERLEVIGTLTSVIAHQLKNPLSIIRGAVSSIQRRCNNKNLELNQFVEILQHESERTQNILQRFLNFAKSQNIVKQPVQLSNFLKEIIAPFDSDIDLLELKLEVENSLWADLDKGLFSEALLNIIENAKDSISDAKPDRPLLQIKCAQQEQLILLTFTDNGIGIPSSNIEHVFDPFYTTKPKGTGLGLSMAKKIIILHGGSIEMQNQKNQIGAIVSIQLPISSSS